MIIQVDIEGRKAVQQLCDIALKSAGIENLNPVNLILSSVRLLPTPKIEEKLQPKSPEKEDETASEATAEKQEEVKEEKPEEPKKEEPEVAPIVPEEAPIVPEEAKEEVVE